MVIDMNDSKLLSVAQVREYLAGSRDMVFSVSGWGDCERYAFIQRTINRFKYAGLGKADKGAIRSYVMHCTGYARAQVTRLIARCQSLASDQTMSKRYKAPASAYASKYTPADVALLVEVDMAYENACGGTTVAVLKRQRDVYKDARFERLGDLSASHLYNLRASRGYKSQRIEVAKTRPTPVSIGVRKAPQPNGQAGYVRVDSVHQGDEDKRKGVYHITCVDSVTQWTVTVCVKKISEAFLLDALEQAIALFPFKIHAFHSDNGSEYINKKVAALLQKLLIEQTKSRPRHSNDNALAESKNRHIVRRHMGYEHIPNQLADPINQFYQTHFNDWVNYHRPCLYATEVVNAKGKVVKKYKHEDTQTPLDKLTALCAVKLATLKQGITLKALHTVAHSKTDLQATQEMQEAKSVLWSHILRFKKAARVRSHQSASQQTDNHANDPFNRQTA